MMTAVLVGELALVVTAGMTAWAAWGVGRAAAAWTVDSGATDTAPVATRRQAS